METSKEEEQFFKDFETMGLKENLMRGIFGYGFEHPSEIQSKAIVPISQKRDIIAQAQSGTGKTGTFVIGTLQRIDDTVDGCQAIIVAPTRELAIQIHDVCGCLALHMKVKPVLCVGGGSIMEAKKELEKGATIVVGTPGRILDMINRGHLSTRLVQVAVMDEADELLANSFLDQIKDLMKELPNTCQVCIFSATYTDEVLSLTRHFMVKPYKVLITPEALTLDGISQFYIDVEHDKWKCDTFCELYDMFPVNQSMVYVNTRNRAEWLRDKLQDKNFTVSIIHSQMKPTERASIMKQFRSGGTRVLISTDLLSRGIDIQQVSIVINYDLPNRREAYIHRIGRSGRFGRKGVAINLVTRNDFRMIDELRKYYGADIVPMPQDIASYL